MKVLNRALDVVAVVCVLLVWFMNFPEHAVLILVTFLAEMSFARAVGYRSVDDHE